MSGPVNGTGSRRRILVVSPFVPHAQLPHAGGQYLFAHLTALRRHHDCVLIVPDHPENRQAVVDGGAEFDPVLVAPDADAGTRRGRARLLYGNLRRPLEPPASYRTALLDAVRERLDELDAVELQWPEYAGLLPAIRRLAPHVPAMVVEHDVLSQRVSRDRVVGRTRRTRVRARLTYARVRDQERTALNQADQVLVFSDKDAELLRGNGVTRPVDVLLPPLEDPRMWTPPPFRRRRRLLFVAAFDREVNDVAARWFLDEVFPRVRAAVPDAELVLAGARMRDDLRAQVDRTPGVELTGFVADLGAVDRATDLAVVPLLSGAGLKFKVATAMMWGMPVVSTSVGAEGYPVDDQIFAGVSDDAAGFAAAVVTALQASGPTDEAAERGRRWALDTFSQDAFEQRLRALYAPLTADVAEQPR